MASGVMIAGNLATLAIQRLTLVGMVLERGVAGRIGRKTGSFPRLRGNACQACFVNGERLVVHSLLCFVDMHARV